jgi:hypothetical protein
VPDVALRSPRLAGGDAVVDVVNVASRARVLWRWDLWERDA